MYSVYGVLRNINKLKDEHYYYIQTLEWSGIQVFSLLPVFWSAFSSPADQSRYFERSYCTQILLESYIIYPIHQSMFFTFLYHIFFMFCIKNNNNNKNNISFCKKILSSLTHKRQPTSTVHGISFHHKPLYLLHLWWWMRGMSNNWIYNRVNYIIIITGQLLLILLLFATLCFIYQKRALLWPDIYV